MAFSPTIVSVDVTARALQLIHAKPGAFSKPPSILKRSSVVLEVPKDWKQALEAVPEALETFLETHAIRNPFLYIGLPREAGFIQELRLPKAAKADLHQAVKYELLGRIPLTGETICFNFQRLPNQKADTDIRVLAVAIPRPPVDALLDALSEKGRLPEGIGMGTIGMANTLLTLSDMGTKQPLMLLTGVVGALETLVIDQGKLRYAKYQSTSPKDLPLDSQRLQSEWREACSEIAETLEPPRIILAGEWPGGDREHLDQMEMENPPQVWEKAALPDGGWSFVGAYGLVLMHNPNSPNRINLMPSERRKRPSRWGLYTMVALLVLAVAAGTAFMGGYLWHKRRTLTLMDETITQLEETVTLIESRKSAIAQIDQRLQYLNEIQKQRFKLLDILQDMTLQIPDTAWLQNIDIRPEKVTIQGHAQSASELLPMLEQAARFREVVFLSTITRDRQGNERFRIGLKVAPD